MSEVIIEVFTRANFDFIHKKINNFDNKFFLIRFFFYKILIFC